MYGVQPSAAVLSDLAEPSPYVCTHTYGKREKKKLRLELKSRHIHIQRAFNSAQNEFSRFSLFSLALFAQRIEPSSSYKRNSISSALSLYLSLSLSVSRIFYLYTCTSLGSSVLARLLFSSFFLLHSFSLLHLSNKRRAAIHSMHSSQVVYNSCISLFSTVY